LAQGTTRLRSHATRFKSIFSYYGGKSRIAHLYPPPQHDTIIEPLCGAASYSAQYAERNVLLYDSDSVTASIWNFLLSPNALEQCRVYIPDKVLAGWKITEMMESWPLGIDEGLLHLMQAEANAGTQGAKGVHNQITKFGAASWHRFLPKMEYWIPRIRHWRFSRFDYNAIPNLEATWFIDPPYNNIAGQRYRTRVSDYHKLGEWCIDRWGQVIVCENYGATWLPFEPLAQRRGVVSSYQKSRAMEAVYVQENRFSQAA